MVRSKGGGSGEKEGRGEEAARSEGGRGMYWWAVRPMQLVGSTPSPFVVVRIGLASLLSSILVCLCTFRVVLCCGWPRIWHGVRWRGLAVERHWPVDGGGVALVGWVCPVIASGGCGWFSWALAVLCGLLCVSRVVLAIVGRSW